MKRYRRMAVLAMAVLAVAVSAAASLGQAAGTAYAAILGQGVQDADKRGGPGVVEIDRNTKAPAVVDGVVQPQDLEAAKKADQMTMVVGTDGCNADTYYYAKSEDSLELVWKETPVMGQGGATSDRGEGDGKTPSGTYGLTTAFGLRGDPGSMPPYHRVVKGDYRMDSPSSSCCNQLVDTSVTSRSWSSTENLAAASPYYNYALALNYDSGRVPGKGSAIFLHYFTAPADNGSTGCIRLPESRAKKLVQTTTKKTRIVIAADITQLK